MLNGLMLFYQLVLRSLVFGHIAQDGLRIDLVEQAILGLLLDRVRIELTCRLLFALDRNFTQWSNPYRRRSSPLVLLLRGG